MLVVLFTDVVVVAGGVVLCGLPFDRLLLCTLTNFRTTTRLLAALDEDEDDDDDDDSEDMDAMGFETYGTIIDDDTNADTIDEYMVFQDVFRGECGKLSVSYRVESFVVSTFRVVGQRYALVQHADGGCDSGTVHGDPGDLEVGRFEAYTEGFAKDRETRRWVVVRLAFVGGECVLKEFLSFSLISGYSFTQQTVPKTFNFGGAS